MEALANVEWDLIIDATQHSVVPEQSAQSSLENFRRAMEPRGKPVPPTAWKATLEGKVEEVAKGRMLLWLRSENSNHAYSNSKKCNE